MVNSLLFRWEDSQALQHHCGFCERPLSHPGAKASCFGTHSEPCHRFHQMMFMRNRGHMCNYCKTIDEAHYKRHHDLITHLRSIYECCGEADWAIIPVESGDPRRGHPSDTPTADDEISDRCLRSEEAPTSKRERKDAKSLIRATARTKVVTQDEIRYIDAVLHSSEGVASGGASLANMDEVQLIEEHLRYNANVYNNHSSRKALRHFAKIPEVDVDFESELKRVLDTFRITELLKRNLKNRGLQGKELRAFDTLVHGLRIAVMEDLVLVKKDTMEIRMRRAGYMRYTNKTAYSVVEDRYTERDWKTGERITSAASEFSGPSSVSLEPFYQPSEVPAPPVPTHSFPRNPDRRHLQHVHTRINGDDGLGQKFIEPYHAPLLPLTPNAAPKRPAILQLKIIEDKENQIPAGGANHDWLRHDVARHMPVEPAHGVAKDVLPPSLSPTKAATTQPSAHSIKKAWWKIPDPISLTESSPTVDEDGFPSLKIIVERSQIATTNVDSLAVQPPAKDVTTSLQGPERPMPHTGDTEISHPVVSQKKAKKMKKAMREAKRKARKASEPPEETLSSATKAEAGFQQAAHEVREQPTSSSVHDNTSPATIETSPQRTTAADAELKDNKKDDGSTKTFGEESTIVDASTESSITTIPRTSGGRHGDWVRFLHEFTVDQLTGPLHTSFKDCSHASSCQFEGNGVLDCPFHHPRCPCADPLVYECGILYPGEEFCTLGPYNRAHGQRLMAMFEQHDLTRDRVMLVDPDILPTSLDFNALSSKPIRGSVAPRLLRDHAEFDGYNRDPYLKQEAELQRLYLKNSAMKLQLTEKMLLDIQRQNDSWEGSVQLCYCKTAVKLHIPDVFKEFKKGIVICSYSMCEFGTIFHERCVKNLGVEKVSQWYCTACEKKMDMWAHRALNLPYKDDSVLGSLTKEERLLAEKISARVKGSGTMAGFKQRLQPFKLQDLYPRTDSENLEVEDVD